LLSFNPFQAMDFNINFFPYLLGLSLGLIAKFRGRWI